MAIKTRIELEHTSEEQLKRIRKYVVQALDDRHDDLHDVDADPASDADWAALFNFLCDLDTPGYEL